jgi:hypothetical protein
MTPEGRIKARVNRVFSHWDGIYKFMPVQHGFGMPTLDFLVAVKGKFLGIETKAPGKKLTPRQEETAKQIREAGGTVLVIDSEDMSALNAYLNSHTERKYPISPEDARRARLKSRHGITPEDYERMLKAQEGHCVFCPQTPDKEAWGVLCVDHDHETMRIRGLLCRNCNRSLARFGDNAAGIQRVLDYVKCP